MVTSARKASLRRLQYGTTAKLEARIALHQRFGSARDSFHAWVGRRLPLRGPVEILEVGCGICALWRENLARLAEGSRLTLTDISPAMVEQCRRNLGRGRIRFAVADGEDLPFAPACFDLVNAHSSSFDWFNLDQKECVRCLHPLQPPPANTHSTAASSCGRQGE